MSPQTRRKIIKNIEARVLPYTIIGLLVLTSISTVLFINYDSNIAGASATIDFTYYKKITIDHNQVSATLSNFPVLINISGDSDIDGLAAEDFAFWNSDNSTQYAHEIDVYDDSTHSLVAWVNVTSLSHDSDTVIYMYYGDGDSTTEEDITGTWHSDFVMVQHFTGASAVTLDDSTSNNNDVTGDNGDPAYNQTGWLGNAIVLDGTGDYLTVNDDNSLTFSTGDSADTGLTFIALAEYSSGNSYILGKREGTTVEYLWGLSSDASSNKLRLTCYDDAAANGLETDTTNGITKSERQLLATTYNGDGSCDNVIHYVDGSAVGSGCSDSSYTAMHNKAIQLRIGDCNDYGPMTGTIDELFVLSNDKSSDFILTLYNNWWNATSGGFYTVGSGNNANVEGDYEIWGINADIRFTHSAEAGSTNTSSLVLKIGTNTSGTSDTVNEISLDFSAGYPSGFTAGNFSYQVRNTSDGTFSTNWDTVTGNMTLNSTTWAENWAYGTSPFPISGFNSTIEVRMRVAVNSSISAGTYTTDVWKVLWEVET